MRFEFPSPPDDYNNSNSTRYIKLQSHDYPTSSYHSSHKAKFTWSKTAAIHLETDEGTIARGGLVLVLAIHAANGGFEIKFLKYLVEQSKECSY